jgi:hypothetical protein
MGTVVQKGASDEVSYNDHVSDSYSEDAGSYLVLDTGCSPDRRGFLIAPTHITMQ